MKDLEDKIKEYKTPLKYAQFKKYYIKNKYTDNMWEQGKHQWLFKFENNYGASVIKHYGSYGFKDDLFELAVIYFDGDDWSLTYNTPITNDVIGCLTNRKVLGILRQIQRLDENGR